MSVLELKLPVASCLTWLLETEPESSTRAVSTLNHWAVTLTSTAVLSLVSWLLFLKVYFIHVQYMCIHLCVTCAHVCMCAGTQKPDEDMELWSWNYNQLWVSETQVFCKEQLTLFTTEPFIHSVRQSDYSTRISVQISLLFSLFCDKLKQANEFIYLETQWKSISNWLAEISSSCTLQIF